MDNPYDFPIRIGPCARCMKQDAPVVGCVCVSCMTESEKKSYGIDQEFIEEDNA